MGLTTVAEGAETEDVLEKLKLFGCEMVQGYYFTRPLMLLRIWSGIDSG